MTAFLALAGALIIGASDFGGGVAARRASEFRVTLWIQAASLLTILALVGFVDAPDVTGRDVVAGVVAGLAGTFSFVALYGAFARGQIARLAPVTAVLGAVIPTVVGVGRGDDLAVLQAIGCVAALVGVVLVTQERTEASGPPATPPLAFGLAVVAGVGFAIFFLALAETQDDAGLWPLVVARTVSVPVVAIVALTVTGGVMLSAPAMRIVIAAGAAEALANVLALWAFQRGPLPVASVMSAFYPVSTVLLAWFALGERLRRVQWLGVAIAVASIGIVAA